MTTSTSCSLAAVLIALVGCTENRSRLMPDTDERLEIFEAAYCPPQMERFPVEAAHNIGYDNASCGSGTCDISCPDANANSDWGGSHHGIDIFAYQRAPLVAVAAGEVVRVGTPSSTSGLRVRLRDACGWEYYYGHMDEAVVSEGQWVNPGDVLGYMGYTGTGSTHLHFNVSYDGDYSDDIDPIDLLVDTSATACDGSSGSGSGSSGSGSGSSSGSGSGSGSGSSSGSTGSGGATMGECGWATGTTTLASDQTIESCDGRFTLYMQNDGNLVLYRNGGGALWSSGTQGNSGATAVMQGDGNLVVYSAWGTALWASWTQAYSGAVLWVQDDGNLVIYSGSAAVWTTGTGG